MSWTTPPLAVTNTVITASIWNTTLRDDGNYLNSVIWTLIGSAVSGRLTLPAGYNNARVIGYVRSAVAATTDTVAIYVNNAGSSGIWDYCTFDKDGGATAMTSANNGLNQNSAFFLCNGATSTANEFTQFEIIIPEYTNTTPYKTLQIKSTYAIANAATTDIHWQYTHAVYKSTAAITEVDISSTGGSLSGNMVGYGEY
jgi:hypothetical protein